MSLTRVRALLARIPLTCLQWLAGEVTRQQEQSRRPRQTCGRARASALKVAAWTGPSQSATQTTHLHTPQLPRPPSIGPSTQTSPDHARIDLASSLRHDTSSPRPTPSLRVPSIARAPERRSGSTTSGYAPDPSLVSPVHPDEPRPRQDRPGVVVTTQHVELASNAAVPCTTNCPSVQRRSGSTSTPPDLWIEPKWLGDIGPSPGAAKSAIRCT
ncbi:hypothetical protein BDV93DRAFT_561613 [Ceratobasidium sp. AG-I]|nr:hypothetical protein BDV93DRAFT_561613 [Ceratobasidium sp. AG-I]